MARFFWTNVRGIAAAIALIAALALPAAAAAKPHWHALPASPPGGDDIAVIDGSPAVAYVAADGVHVARASRNGRIWQQLGGPIRHTAGAQVFDVDLAVDPSGRPWVAWTETDARGIRQARVAVFVGGKWREVVGGDRPINIEIPEDQPPLGAHTPRLTFFGGRVWLAYVQDTLSESVIGVRRLSADGSRWEVVPAPQVTRPGSPQLVVSGGKLYLAVADVLVPGYRVFPYDPATDRFSEGAFSEFGAVYDDASDLGGRPAVLATGPDGALAVSVLGADGTLRQVGGALASNADGQDLEGRYAAWIENGTVRTAYLSGGRWRAITVPGNRSATFARLASGRGGTWLLWRDAGGTARVARLTGA